MSDSEYSQKFRAKLRNVGLKHPAGEFFSRVYRCPVGKSRIASERLKHHAKGHSAAPGRSVGKSRIASERLKQRGRARFFVSSNSRKKPYRV